jgi:hypothetical protein
LVPRHGRPAVRSCFGLWGRSCRRVCSRGLPTPRHDAALLLVSKGLHSVVVRLLAASLGAWYCLTISGAVRNNVEERRSRQRQPVKTWPATDRSGVSSMAVSSRCSTKSQDSADNFFDHLARWRQFVQGGSNVMTSNLGGGLRLDSVSTF